MNQEMHICVKLDGRVRYYQSSATTPEVARQTLHQHLAEQGVEPESPILVLVQGDKK